MQYFATLQTQFSQASSQILHLVDPHIPNLVIILLGLALIYVVFQVIRLILFYRQTKDPAVIYELQPLKRTEQSAFTTEQLFAVLHGLAKQSNWLHRFFDIAKQYSFEIVSTKAGGITYYTRIPQDDADLVKKSLLSYLPGISVKEVPDYLSKLSRQYRRVSSYKLAKHFAYPLKHQDLLDQHDPIAYLTGSMTKLSDDDLIGFQLILSPLKKSNIASIAEIVHLIHSGKDLISVIGSSASSNTISQVIRLFLSLILRVLMLPIGLLVFLFTDGKEGPFLHMPGEYKPLQTPNPYQEELLHMVKEKIDQQLFMGSIRLLVASNNYAELHKRERGFTSALSSLTNGDYQSLVPSLRLKLRIISRIKYYLFSKRIMLPLSSSILSATEVSDLYHFPFTTTTKTEDLLKQHSKELPAPLSLKKPQQLDIRFAENTYGGNTTTIGLTTDERRRHVYIIGATGTGKSTMLLSMIKQDVDNGKGLAVVDPHGDLTDQIISVIPKERIADVVYFNPDDIGYPMGINLLELTPGLPEEQAIREKEFIAESIISVFQKIYTDKYSGPRMEYILRNTIHTAFTVPDATLFTIYKLLINTSYRKSVTKNLTDENLKDFWKYEFAKAGDYQKVKMISPITNKIGRFLFSPTAKRILEQGKST